MSTVYRLSSVVLGSLAIINIALADDHQLQIHVYDQQPISTAPENVEQSNDATTAPLTKSAEEQTALKVHIFDSRSAVERRTREANKNYQVESSEFNLGIGYRTGSLDWTIGLPGGPNILSELNWDDLDVVDLNLSSNILYKDNLYLEGSVNLGAIRSGRVQDSDFFSNNRQDEFSRSTASTDGDDILDVSLALGYRLRLKSSADKQVYLQPMLGYTRSEQNFRITNGVQVVNAINDSLGEFDGLNSQYRAEWDGYWLGAELGFKQGAWSWFVRAQYYQLDYKADATWNLREDFAQPISFEHRADGDGQSLSVGFTKQIRNNWLLGMNLHYTRFQTEQGVDTTFFADDTTGEAVLNGVDWKSSGLFFNVTHLF